MNVIVTTSIYGGYDAPKPHPNHPAVSEWICYTDDETLHAPGWTVIVEPSPRDTPRMAAKVRKCRPPAADVSIWIDGSVRIHDPALIDIMLESLERGDIALWPHPARTSLLDEAEAALVLPKWQGCPLREMAQHYVAEGWPDNELWAATVFARRHTPEVLAWGEAWLAECDSWGDEFDQLSMPVLIRKFDLVPVPLPHSLWRNPWLGLHAHTRSDR